MSTPIIPFGEIVGKILKILESGYSSSVVMVKRSDLQAGCGWEREADKKNFQKFSIDMMLSLHTLCKKGATWGRVFDVIESFLKYFVPRKMSQKVQPQTSSDANTSILVQATSQISKVMLESALDVLLFLNYMVSASGQVSFFLRTYCSLLKMSDRFKTAFYLCKVSLTFVYLSKRPIFFSLCIFHRINKLFIDM